MTQKKKQGKDGKRDMEGRKTTKRRPEERERERSTAKEKAKESNKREKTLYPDR